MLKLLRVEFGEVVGFNGVGVSLRMASGNPEPIEYTK